MNESEFSEAIAHQLHPFVDRCRVATKKVVLYSVTFDDAGKLQIQFEH
jgi:hypothetical protein